MKGILKYKYILKICLICIFTVFFSSSLYSKDGVSIDETDLVKREDFKKLESSICGGKEVLTTTLWNNGIYDSGVSGNLVSLKSSTSLDDSKLETIARKYAIASKHSGYYWGRCSSNKVWMVSSPAPNPLVKVDSSKYEMDLSFIKNKCSKYEINYVKKDTGSSKVIRTQVDDKEITKVNLNLDLFKDGSISVSCKNSKDLFLMYLAPVKGGVLAEVPLSTFLKSTIADASSLIVWINNIRRKEGLEILDFMDSRLSSVSSSLMKNKKVEHDVELLKKISDFLYKNNFKFIGEDRVKGNSFSEMVWLLWNSPTHRSLLLNKKATHGGVKYDYANKLAVILLGKSLDKVEEENRIAKLIGNKKDKDKNRR